MYDKTIVMKWEKYVFVVDDMHVNCVYVFIMA